MTEDRRSLEEEIRDLLIAVHKKGAGLPEATDKDPLVITVETLLAYLTPIIATLEEGMIRLARELDNLRGA